MNKLDIDYQFLLNDILANGVEKNTRNGKVLSVFGRQIRHSMKDGFPLLTTKKMYFKGICVELLWFLKGDTNIKFLVDNDCHIWVGDAYQAYLKQFEVDPNNFNVDELVKGHGDQCSGYPILDHVKPTSKEYKRGQINAYLEGKADKPFFYLTKEEFIDKIKTDDEFAKKWGELGPVYGAGWRNFEGVDQIEELIDGLKNNPDSRRLRVSAWQPHKIKDMILPPCHTDFQVWTRELTWEEQVQWVMKNTDVELENLYIVEEITKESTPKRAISLMFNMRSTDAPLGLPFNIASYGLLLEIIAKMVNMVPDDLIGNLGDCHIYNNQIDGVKQQLSRGSLDLPTLKINSGNQNWQLLNLDDVINSLDPDITFKVENYKSCGIIKFPLSN